MSMNSADSDHRRKVIPAEELTSLRGWFPVAIAENQPTASITWSFVGSHRFTHPFFTDSLSAIPPELQLLCQTSPESLVRFSEIDCIAPTAFIFHASRCGSTLMTQLLATLPQCIVISEAPVIDSAISLCHSQTTENSGLEVLTGVVRALGQRRSQDERYLFIKLDSWHIIHLALIRAAFPDTPCFFVYRDPWEIFLSHHRQRGSQMVPGLLKPEMLGLDHRPMDPANLEGYCIRVLSSIFRSATVHAEQENVLLINYDQLPVLVWTQFAEFFSMTLSDREIETMQARSSQHSKQPTGVFEKERRQHRTEEIDTFGDLERYYNTLERSRLSQKFFPH